MGDRKGTPLQIEKTLIEHQRIQTMSELYDAEVTPLLQNAGEYIARLRPANERVAWVMFLVDQIKPFLTEDEFDEFLRDLRTAVGNAAAR